MPGDEEGQSTRKGRSEKRHAGRKVHWSGRRTMAFAILYSKRRHNGNMAAELLMRQEGGHCGIIISWSEKPGGSCFYSLLSSHCMLFRASCAGLLFGICIRIWVGSYLFSS